MIHNALLTFSILIASQLSLYSATSQASPGQSTPTVSVTQGTSVVNGRETTTPNQFIWQPNGQSSVADTLFATTTFFNVAASTNAAPGTSVTPITTTPEVVLALKNSNAITPGYELHITYSSTNGYYSIYLIKQGASGMLNNCNITQSAFPSLWTILEQWRSGTEIPVTFSYVQGTFILCLSNTLVWSYSDASPLTGINSITVSSINNPMQYASLVVTNAVTTTNAGISQFIPFNSANPLTVTFKAQTVPTTLTCNLYTKAGQGPQYAVGLTTTNGTVTTLTHTQQPAQTSGILNSTGSYSLQSALVPAAQQTYFLTYTPSAQGTLVAFGLLTQNGAQQTPQTLMNWKNPSTTEQACSILEINSAVALDTLTVINQAGSPPFTPPTLSPIDIQNQGSNYTITGMNNSVAYKDQTKAWLYPLAFPQADSGALTFTLQLTNPLKIQNNGAVILFGTQATGQATYGICIEPDTTQQRTFDTVATQSRVRLFSLNQNGAPQYQGGSVTIPSQTPGGQYQVIYQKINNAASIGLYTLSNNTPSLLANFPIAGAISGITTATLSSQCSTVTYSNVSVASAPSQIVTSAPQTSGGFDLSALRSISLNPTTDNLSFYWNNSAFQQSIDQTNGFTVQSTIAFANPGDQTIAIGLSPSNPNTTTNKFYFTTGGTTTTGFSGATQLVLVTFKSATTECARFMPSAAGTTTPLVSSKISQTTLTGSSGTLWLNYSKTSATAYTVSIGINSAVGTNPLFTWNGVRSSDTATDFSAFAFGTWGSTVTFSNIQVTAAAPASTTPDSTQNTPPAPGVTGSTGSTGTTPTGTLTRTITDANTYDWTVGKSSTNPLGVIDSTSGGVLTALVQVTQMQPNNTANIMIGLTSNTASTAAAQTGGAAIFRGAEYNIELTTTPNASSACLLPAIIPAGASSLVGAASVTGLKALLQTTPSTGATSTPTYPQCLVWARYTPTATGRLFEAGLLPADAAASSAATAPALWSYTEPQATTGTARAPIQFMSISTLTTGATISAITVTPLQAAGSTTGGTSGNTQTQPAVDGTLDSNNIPIASQWTASVVKTLVPNTIQKIATFGSGLTSRAVIAFQQQTAPGTPAPASGTVPPLAFRIVLSSTGCKIYDKDNTQQAESTTAANGGLVAGVGTNYWFTIKDGTLSLGGYDTNLTMLTTPYVSWSNEILKGTNTWTFTTGASSDGSSLTLTETVGASTTPTGTTLPSVIRSGKAGYNPAFRGTEPQPDPTATQTTDSNAGVTSQQQESSRYRINRRRNAV